MVTLPSTHSPSLSLQGLYLFQARHLSSFKERNRVQSTSCFWITGKQCANTKSKFGAASSITSWRLGSATSPEFASGSTTPRSTHLVSEMTWVLDVRVPYAFQAAQGLRTGQQQWMCCVGLDLWSEWTNFNRRHIFRSSFCHLIRFQKWCCEYQERCALEDFPRDDVITKI